MINQAELLNTTTDLAAAERAFVDFIEQFAATDRLVAMHDSDADGVTAGVVWQRALMQTAYQNLVRLTPDRERNAWTAGNRARVAQTAPNGIFLLDMGSQSTPIIPGIKTCFIDHHRPEGVPIGDTLISAYSWQPIPNTSLLTWQLCAQIADVSALDWIAAIGVLSDLGDKAPFEMLAAAKKRYTAKYLKEATVLINSARRAASYDPERAARVLLEHPDPRALVNSNSDDVEQLRIARAEVKAAMEEAKKAAPIFAGNVALVRVRSRCQVHPLIAQIWRTRLPKYIVIVANEEYLPGRVNFSARAVNANVLDFLQGIKISDGEGDFGHGHDQASGGSLSIARWNELLAKMGFAETVFAPVS